LTLLALGDSYTIGEGVAPSERWPDRLAAALRIPPPAIIARTGWTTDELSAAVDAAAPPGPFDFVTLLIGVNDQYRGRDVVNYRAEFVALLGRALSFGRHAIVVSIPDWGVTPFAEGRDRAKIAREIDAYNSVNRDEAAKLGARYADITPITRRHPLMLAPDGLHPSGEMYALWTVEILKLMTG
jgi:lysophospholipase L1-like esterase